MKKAFMIFLSVLLTGPAVVSAQDASYYSMESYTGSDENGSWIVQKQWDEAGNLRTFDSSYTSKEAVRDMAIPEQTPWGLLKDKFNRDVEPFFEERLRLGAIDSYDPDEFSRRFKMSEEWKSKMPDFNALFEDMKKMQEQLFSDSFFKKEEAGSSEKNNTKEL